MYLIVLKYKYFLLLYIAAFCSSKLLIKDVNIPDVK